jgi:tRNA1Val (adenine37-N6)-methyltransferase
MCPVFRFKKFAINDDGCAMKVNTDGVLLGAWANTENAKYILDIGTGSGLIAMILAQRCEALIDAIDIHAPSISMAIENVKNSPWPERIKCKEISLQEYALTSYEDYDLIVSNPPYFESSLQSSNPEKNIAKHNTLLPSEELIRDVKDLLKKNRRFCLILPFERASQFKVEAEMNGLFTEKITYIKGKTDKPVNRVMFEFSKKARIKKAIVNEISIRNLNENFTSEYRNLTSDLYLQF